MEGEKTHYVIGLIVPTNGDNAESPFWDSPRLDLP